MSFVLLSAETGDSFVETTDRNNNSATKIARRVFASGLLQISGFCGSEFALKSEVFLLSAETDGSFVEMTEQNAAISWKWRLEITMTAQKNDGAEPDDRTTSFRLWFVVQFGFFMELSLFLKVSLFSEPQ